MTAQLPSRERLSDDLLGQIAFYAGEAICHPDHNYALEYQKLAYPANVLALVNEVIASRALLTAHEQEPVGIVRYVCAGLERPGIHVSLYDTSLPDGTELFTRPAPVPAVSTREKLAALQLASIINDLGLPENAPFVEITSEIFRLKQLESPAPAVPDIDTWRTAFEYSERQRDEGFNLHKFGTGYADDATQKRWESWLSSRAAMLNGGKS